jgi:phosphatidylethanolamine/phosphatidyl-N-methylethanolamine N-methyltransferase
VTSAKDAIGFFREFLRHPISTGALLPSSRALADMMVEEAKVSQAASVAELGSGTGVCTERILESRKPQAAFLVLEINLRFLEKTRERCPGVEIHQDSAVHLPRYVERNGGKKFDAIVSGLPWASFGEDLQRQILDAVVLSLAPRGRFVTFAYLQGLLLPSGRRFSRMLLRRFPSVRRTRVVWRNVPPAFVYVAESLLASLGS